MPKAKSKSRGQGGRGRGQSGGGRVGTRSQSVARRQAALDPNMPNPLGTSTLAANQYTPQTVPSQETPKATLSRQHPELFATRSTITVPVSIGTDDLYSRMYFQYYNAEEDRWMELDRIASSPHRTRCSSLLEVNGELYNAGGLVENPDNVDELETIDGFYHYNSEENAWTELSPMNAARRRFPMVHLDGFIYAISGTCRPEDREYNYIDQAYEMGDACERYDVASKKWEVLAPLPVKVYHCAVKSCISAVAFRGKIIVYGAATVDESPKHVLLVYHPNTGRWQIALCEEHDEKNLNSFDYIPPVLFVYQDICYRIKYPITPESHDDQSPKSVSQMRRPVVNTLEFISQGDDDISVTVGPEIKQDYVPDDTLSAFRIHDEVFLDNCGLVYKTSIRIDPDQNSNVSLCKYKKYSDFYRGSNARSYMMSNNTYFTFNRKLLE